MIDFLTLSVSTSGNLILGRPRDWLNEDSMEPTGDCDIGERTGVAFVVVLHMNLDFLGSPPYTLLNLDLPEFTIVLGRWSLSLI